MKPPDEAVAAALDAVGEKYGWDGVGLPELARTILEAAAPHMGSHAAWHDAVAEAYVEGALSTEQANVMWNKNPYRSKA